MRARMASASSGLRLVLPSGVDANACGAPCDAQQTAVVEVVEQMRRRVRRPAPVVRDGPMRETLMRLAWMDAAALTHECQQVLRSFLASRRPGGRDLPRVHQRGNVSGDEAVVDEDVFLDAEGRIQPLEVAGVIADGAMTQRQILGPRRRADRIRLHESQPPQRVFQRDGGNRLRATANRRRWSRPIGTSQSTSAAAIAVRRVHFRLRAWTACVRHVDEGTKPRKHDRKHSAASCLRAFESS